jgi:insulysin
LSASALNVTIATTAACISVFTTPPVLLNPQVHLRLHLVTPAVYASPAATVSTRMLLRVLDDLLLPVAYPAELAGSSYSLDSEQGGLLLKLTGFPGVMQQLLGLVLQGLLGE